MPIVGHDTSAVMRSASAGGTASMTIAKQPAASSARASAAMRSASSGVRALAPVDGRGLGQQAHVTHHRDAVGDDRRDLRHQAALELHRVGAGLHQDARARDRLLRGAVGPGGQVAADVGRRGAVAHRAHVVGHHLQGDGPGAVVAELDLAEAVAHQQDVETAGVERQGRRVVVGGQHHQARPTLARPRGPAAVGAVLIPAPRAPGRRPGPRRRPGGWTRPRGRRSARSRGPRPRRTGRR